MNSRAFDRAALNFRVASVNRDKAPSAATEAAYQTAGDELQAVHDAEQRGEAPAIPTARWGAEWKL